MPLVSADFFFFFMKEQLKHMFNSSYFLISVFLGFALSFRAVEIKSEMLNTIR